MEFNPVKYWYKEYHTLFTSNGTTLYILKIEMILSMIWIHNEIIKDDDLIYKLSDNLSFSISVDALMQQVKVLQEAFTEINIYLDKIYDELIQETEFESDPESENDEGVGID